MTNSTEKTVSTLSDQIDDLQTRLTFQEDALLTLSQQIALQDQELQTARQHIQLLNEKLNDLFYQLEQRAEGIVIERPPHY